MAAQKLTHLTDCADIKSLTQEETLPSDKETATKVALLRGQLAQIKALEDAGRYKEVLPLAVDAVAAARASSCMDPCKARRCFASVDCRSS